jgi:hypothetical protein
MDGQDTRAGAPYPELAEQLRDSFMSMKTSGMLPIRMTLTLVCSGPDVRVDRGTGGVSSDHPRIRRRGTGASCGHLGPQEVFPLEALARARQLGFCGMYAPTDLPLKLRQTAIGNSAIPLQCRYQLEATSLHNSRGDSVYPPALQCVKAFCKPD